MSNVTSTQSKNPYGDEVKIVFTRASVTGGYFEFYFEHDESEGPLEYNFEATVGYHPPSGERWGSTTFDEEGEAVHICSLQGPRKREESAERLDYLTQLIPDEWKAKLNAAFAGEIPEDTPKASDWFDPSRDEIGEEFDAELRGFGI